MLKLFLLERGALINYGRTVILAAAESEESARAMAAEKYSEFRANLWLKSEREVFPILTDVTLQDATGATCKEIGTADPGIPTGILMVISSPPPKTEELVKTEKAHH